MRFLLKCTERHGFFFQQGKLYCQIISFSTNKWRFSYFSTLYNGAPDFTTQLGLQMFNWFMPLVIIATRREKILCKASMDSSFWTTTVLIVHAKCSHSAIYIYSLAIKKSRVFLCIYAKIVSCYSLNFWNCRIFYYFANFGSPCVNSLWVVKDIVIYV